MKNTLRFLCAIAAIVISNTISDIFAYYGREIPWLGKILYTVIIYSIIHTPVEFVRKAIKRLVMVVGDPDKDEKELAENK